MRHSTILLAFALCVGCDKPDEKTAADPNSKLLGERLIAEHGEAVLAQPIHVVYDTGWLVGRGSLDPEFSDTVSKLGLQSTSRLSGGVPPIEVDDLYSEEGVELGVDPGGKRVVVDATSSLAIRLVFGEEGLDALRACEKVSLDRVCKVNDELRARLEDIPATGAVLIDRNVEVGRGDIKRGWAVFPAAPEVGDDTQLELLLPDGVRCNLSRWVVDPRDTCAM